MTRLYTIGAIILVAVGIFASGYFAGSNNTNKRWYELNHKAQQQYDQKLQSAIKHNLQITESYNQIMTDLIVQQEINTNVIQQNKALIDSTNRITAQFVQYFKSSKPGSGLQQDHTGSTAKTNEAISPTEFLNWALGLQTHDNQCVNQLNSLIKAVKGNND